MITVDMHGVAKARVTHYTTHDSEPFATVSVRDKHGNVVTLFFTATVDSTALDAAEARLLEALSQVVAAKATVARTQALTEWVNANVVDFAEVSPDARIGEPIDLTENPLITGCQSMSSTGYRCTLAAGHYGDHIDQRSVIAWGNPDSVRATAVDL